MVTKFISINASLNPATAKSVADTLAKLERAGLREANLLAAIGVVTGRIAEGKIDALKKIPGVTIELGETVQIPAPDAPIQ